MPDESSELGEIIRASVQMCLAIVPHIPVVLVTLGKHGVLLCHRFGDASHLLPLPSASNCEVSKITQSFVCLFIAFDLESLIV